MDLTAMAWMKKGTAAHPPRLRLPRMLGSDDATSRSPTPHTPSPSWFWNRLFTLVTKVWRYNPKKIATHVVTLVLFCSGWFETPHNGAGWTHLCACGFIPHGKIGLIDQESVCCCFVNEDLECDLRHASAASLTAYTVDSMVVRTFSDHATDDTYADLLARQPI